MVGIVSLAPLVKILLPLPTPFWALIWEGLRWQKKWRNIRTQGYFGVFLEPVMGPMLVFTIAVALGMIEKQDRPYFSKSILIELCTVLIGCFTGGIGWGDFENILIPSLFSAVIAFGLWRYTERKSGCCDQWVCCCLIET